MRTYTPNSNTQGATTSSSNDQPAMNSSMPNATQQPTSTNPISRPTSHTPSGLLQQKSQGGSNSAVFAKSMPNASEGMSKNMLNSFRNGPVKVMGSGSA